MSRYQKYFAVDVSLDAQLFQFTSVGPKGEFKMIVQFTPTDFENIFNLGFGNLNDDGSIDDRAVNNNKDRDKILATIASIVFEFASLYPDRTVLFTGSTLERTRLYRIVLTVNYEELDADFDIQGLLNDGTIERFQRSKSYKGFMVKRKKN